MKVLIIEDESHAVAELTRLLQFVKCPTQIEIAGSLESNKSAIAWFQNNPLPDLVFMDIQLSDGLSFEIFQHIELTCPIVFCTAFDQYAIRAFKLNSIDYLLKPVEQTELQASFNKYHQLKETFEQATIDHRYLTSMLNFKNVKYKSRFVSKVGDKFRFIMTEDIAYFYADDKIVYLVSAAGDKYIIDYTVESLEPILDPELFFRLNRTYLTKINAIQKVERYFNGRLAVTLAPKSKEIVTVSKDKASKFRAWLGE